MERQEEEIMPPLTDAQQKLLERGEITTTLVDLALASLHNPFLEGEVNAYRNLVEDVFEEWKKEAEV